MLRGGTTWGVLHSAVVTSVHGVRWACAVAKSRLPSVDKSLGETPWGVGGLVELLYAIGLKRRLSCLCVCVCVYMQLLAGPSVRILLLLSRPMLYWSSRACCLALGQL